jgi:uncharacterized protein (TIGR03086 family)
MDTPHQAVVALSRALDQAGDALAEVRADDLDRPTPCPDWTVRQLAGHLSAAPGNFLAMGRGEDVDWSAVPDRGPHDWTDTFRSTADDLIHHWHEQGDEQAPMADMQSAEIAVHTWDLLRGIGRSLPLDPEVAERALAFLERNLTDDNRRPVFGPPVEVDADAPPYDRLAAFAGRDPRA